MRTTIIALVTALLVGGCSPEAGDTAGQTVADPAVSGPGYNADEAAAANLPEIGILHWPDIRPYCAFFAQGHEFEVDDESTWQFVFVAPFSPSGRNAWAVAALDGERQMLSLVSRREANRTVVHRYEVVDHPEIELEVTMVSAGRENASTAYSGSVQIVAPTRGEPVGFDGNCRT